MSLHVIAAMIIGAYLLGSIPFGLILARAYLYVDLRTIGSGNIGATNARRAGGSVFGLIVLLCDLSKGAVPTAIAITGFGNGAGADQIFPVAVAIAAFTGHIYPVYLKFKTGGKGISTAAGCFLVLSPVSFLVALAVFISMIVWSRKVSAGSLTAAAILPICVFMVEDSLSLAMGALIITLLIFLRHRGNIARLMAGTEPTV